MAFRFFFSFSLLRTHTAYCKYEATLPHVLASCTSLLVMRPFFTFRAKKSLHTGVRTGCHYLTFRYVCVRVCDIEFVVFIDCESCARPIPTNPACMEAGEHGLTHGTWSFVRRFEVVSVAGLMWVSWCAFGGGGFFRFFYPSFSFPSNAHGFLQV